MEQSELNLIEVYNDFVKNVINPNNMKSMLVGSLALNILGLEIGKPHDIDIEVLLCGGDENIFKILSEQIGNKFHEQNEYMSAEENMENVTWSHKPYLFKWKDVEINVWVVSEFSHKYIKLDNGIRVAKAMSIIRKKVAYNRKKDIKFLSKMAQKFLSLAEI